MTSAAPLDLSSEGLIARNKSYAPTHKKLPPLLTLLGGDAAANGPHTLIISCLDSRSDPYQVFQLPPFSIFSLRTVAGRISPILSDMAALDSWFHISQIVILQHSNCGASHQTTDSCLAKVNRDRPEISDAALEDLRGKLPFHNNDGESLKADLKRLRECVFLRKEICESVRGLWLDLETGMVGEVDA